MNLNTYQEYLKTKANVENITADLEMNDDMVNRERQNLLHEFEQTCQAIKCFEDCAGLQQNYLQRSYAYEDALEQLGVHYGALVALRKAINQVDWEQRLNAQDRIEFVPAKKKEDSNGN